MTDESPTPAAQILIVDDEVDHAAVMAEALSRLGHVCTSVHDLAEAREELQHGNFDLVVTDLKMEGEEDGLEVLATAKTTQQNTETILVTAHGDVPTATKALKQGAYHFIEKPLDLNVFRSLCEQAIRSVMQRVEIGDLQGRLGEQTGFEGIIGNSAAILAMLATIRQVARTKIPVLVTGDSGTGKELVARAIHAHSDRTRKHFKPLNCAGLSESILESELFGHVKGAFTGAEKDRQGVFEYADGGTLLLDEIGDMPLPMQAKLLRVLENGEVVRVGSNEPRHVDVRLISATNHDLQQLIKDGLFREDLFFRIRGAYIQLPKLCDRRDDIPLLVRHFANHFTSQMNKQPLQIDDEAVSMLTQYDWPGNVRELMNVMQNMVLICDSGNLKPEHIPLEIRQGGGEAGTISLGALAGLSLEQIEKQAIRNALRIHKGNRELTAQMLGIGERTLYRKLKEYGLK